MIARESPNSRHEVSMPGKCGSGIYRIKRRLSTRETSAVVGLCPIIIFEKIGQRCITRPQESKRLLEFWSYRLVSLFRYEDWIGAQSAHRLAASWLRKSKLGLSRLPVCYRLEPKRSLKLLTESKGFRDRTALKLGKDDAHCSIANTR
jgi:hypothetical protein